MWNVQNRDSYRWGAVGAGALVLAASLAGVAACNEHVFEVIDPCSDSTLDQGGPVDPLTKADILVVIDNSGSMCEEQINLAENFLDNDCPLTDLQNIPDEYKNPDDAVLAELTAQCGFIQILAAYENDFRVGVITTDVGDCDNRYLRAEAEGDCNTGADLGEWGRRPQRGCLQAPPGATKKFIEKGDPDIGGTFSDTLRNIQTFGSGFERGLDAVQLFMTPASDRAPGCEDDYNDFIREEAALVVIYVTDEDDCSHVDSDAFPDERSADNCEPAIQSVPASPSFNWCYSKPEQLKPVEDFANFLRGVKGPGREKAVRVAVIAGGMPVGVNADGSKVIEPRGCYIPQSGANAGTPSDECIESQGGTLAFNGECDVNGTDEDRCCIADTGNRYYQLADLMPEGNSFKDSICFDSFRETMVQIAKFAAQTDVVDLEDEILRPNAIEVEITRAGTTTKLSVPRIPDDADPEGQSGWQYTPPAGNLPARVTFYGEWVPKPGDDVSVFTAASGSNSACNADAGNE